MKVLQINCVYKNGSTGKIVYDIHNGLKDNDIESVIVYGRGLEINEKNVYKTSNEFIAKLNNLRSRITGLQYDGAILSTNKILKIIKNESPDVVHLHCINGFFVNIYRLMDYLKVNNIPTIVTLHAEFIHTGNCGHAFECNKWKSGCGKCPYLKQSTHSLVFDRTHEAWVKMKGSFEGFNNIIITSVSPWLHERAKESPILSDKEHHVILNGIDTETIFLPSKFQHLKEKHGLKNEKIILHVTASFKSEDKGGKYIIELAKKFINKNLKIIVIGNKDNNIELPSNIIDVGRVENQKELAEYYSMADLTVITSRKETFSMVCAESLACGTPVVGFKAGAPEQISIPEYSEFVEYGDCNKLMGIIKKWLNAKGDFNPVIFEERREIYSRNIMVNRYMCLYNEVVNMNER